MERACTDSKQVVELKEELFKYRKKDFNEVLKICTVLEAYALQTKDNELLAFAYFYQGEAYYVLNEVELMFQTMAQSVTYLTDTNQWELLARAYNIMAIASINRGHAPVALDYYLTALKYADEHGITSVICSIHINLGYLYMQNEIYEEALHHFDDAYEIYSKSADKEEQIGRLIMIYVNFANCYMLCENMEDAGRYVKHLITECSSYFNNMDYVYVDCMMSRYYHLCGEYTKRDETIEDILNRFGEQLPILDIVDDLYALCELLLEIEKYEVFMKIINELEPVVSHTGMINLYRRFVELKIKYYEMLGDKENYLQTAAHFFKLVSQMEEESHAMIANMIHVRTALENAQKSRKKAEEMNEILTRKSETDPLTGLANRYSMTETFQTMLDECKEKHKLFAVEILDIDYFKQYNDTYGHQAGDECIQKISALIKKVQGENINCFRYGGDEFIILYSGLDAQTVLHKAEKLRKDIMDLHIEHVYSTFSSIATISQGICLAVPAEGDESLEFLHMADDYLYHVKKQERNHICAGNMQGEWEILDDDKY